MTYNRHFLIMRSPLITVFLLFCMHFLYAQDDLLEILEEESEEESYFVSSTFKGTRLINGHSIETRKTGTLEFIISHRFGTLNSGLYNFFGLDDANIRLGLDYAITDRLTIGIGRNSFQKVYDGFLKYKIFGQQAGARPFPVSLVAYSNMNINTLEWANPGDNRTTDRFAYAHQLLVARKINENISLQLMPTLVHRNRVPTMEEDNLVYALGVGGRQKLTQRIALTVEYYYQFNNDSPNDYHNSVAIGFDIETGGHVFQLHFTNSRPIFERGFITETTGDVLDGDIHFGFNITRAFHLRNP